jgi:hypothetical protein
MRNCSIPQNHSVERKITIPEMIARWGVSQTEAVLGAIADTGVYAFTILRRGWNDNYVLVIDAEIESRDFVLVGEPY